MKLSEPTKNYAFNYSEIMLFLYISYAVIILIICNNRKESMLVRIHNSTYFGTNPFFRKMISAQILLISSRLLRVWFLRKHRALWGFFSLCLSPVQMLWCRYHDLNYIKKMKQLVSS
jgi:hypothetical protein